MNHGVIYFDGICNFCNGIVNFIIRNDHQNYFRYTPLQSESGKKFLLEHQFPTRKLDTFYLTENGKTYSHSTAALRLLRHLGWKFSWMYGFIILPAFLRDFFYSILAKNRYRWFGTRDQCMVPTPEVLQKFIF